MHVVGSYTRVRFTRQFLGPSQVAAVLLKGILGTIKSHQASSEEI